MGRHTGKILKGLNLAGRMPLHRQRKIIGGNAAAVITNADSANAAIFKLDLNGACLGINGVFQQLLYHGCGPLHDLASGDLADQCIGKESNGHEYKLRMKTTSCAI